MKFKLENLFDFRQLIKHLSSGLQRLTLDNNFDGNTVTATIASGEEVSIRNPLSFIPTSYILISKNGNGTIYKSNTWTKDFVYFTNSGPDNITIKIFLMR